MKVLIWSMEHQGYWNPSTRTCSTRLCDAGLYSRREAEQICGLNNNSSTVVQRIIELDDAFTSLQLEVRMKINQ